MLKLGILEAAGCPGQARGPLGWLRRNRFAYTLLKTSLPPKAEEILVFERIMQQMKLTSGVYRTTARNRFADLDEWAQPILERRLGGRAAVRIEDWAASACVTSLEWHQRLARGFPRFRLTASDLNLYLLALEVPGDGTYVLETGGGLLQFIRPPFVIRMEPPEPRLLAVNRILGKRARRRLERIWRELGAGPQIEGLLALPEGADEKRLGAMRLVKLPLVHPEAIALANASPESFAIRNHSVFAAAPEAADVVRTMNILNLSYFDRGRLEQGARSVWRSLDAGGVWIVGRTVREQPPEHRASVFEKTAEGFRLLERFGGPSEIEDLALALRV
ncbi:MAG: hypothetical protein ACLQVN_03145 [Bryobacteraceae bacterium]